MILSDRAIIEAIAQGRLVIDPYDETAIQPASIDLTMGSSFVQYRSLNQPHSHGFPHDHGDGFHTHDEPLDRDFGLDGLPKAVDPYEPIAEEDLIRFEADEFALAPGGFVLATTIEWVTLPKDLVGRLEGKSSLARLGLAIHLTAGFVDPGWSGRLTLELFNFTQRPILLRAGMRCCQLALIGMSGPAILPYGHDKLGSKYQGQNEATPSRYSTNRFPHTPTVNVITSL